MHPGGYVILILSSETGNATITAPSGGFDYESLAAVFKRTDSKKPSPSMGKGSMPESPNPTSLKNRVVIGVSVASATVALLSIAGIILIFRRRQRNKLQAPAVELGPKPWERREVDGSMVAPVKHELEGSRPAVYEIGGGERDGERGRGIPGW